MNLTYENERDLIFCSFRYALGRKTYIVSTIADIILKNWEFIPENDRILFKIEIEKAIEQNNAGMAQDVEHWKQILGMNTYDK